MIFDGPYIQRHQLPSDLPVLQMLKVLCWRLSIVASFGGVITLVGVFVLAAVSRPLHLAVVLGSAVGVLLAIAAMIYKLRPVSDPIERIKAAWDDLAVNRSGMGKGSPIIALERAEKD